MILVDTNVWSEATKPNGSREVVRWIETRRDVLWLSTIVIAELRAGIENPDAEPKRSALEEWLKRLENANSDRLMLFDTAAAYALARLLLEKPQDNKMLDTLIAAQAISRGCSVATRNIRDFEWTGVKLIDPWTA